MKITNILATSLFLLSFFSNVQAQERLEIPAQDSIVYMLPEGDYNSVSLHNKSDKELRVQIINLENSKETGGFGLAAQGKVAVALNPKKGLRLLNPSAEEVRVLCRAQKQTETTPPPPNLKQIDFTLVNSSAKSIPLIIPNVMNPNLSPFSKSGVRLAVGQKIYLKKGISRKLLFEVPDSLSNGTQLDVPALLKILQ